METWYMTWSSAQQYPQYTATWQYAMWHCSVLRWTSPDLLRTHRPGDRLGPTSGGSIGSQGMGDLVPGLVLLHLLLRSTLNTLRHGSMLWCIVVYIARPRT